MSTESDSNTARVITLTDEGVGSSDSIISEACRWIVETGSDATKHGKLSEGAYKIACDLAKREFTGVCPNRFRKGMEILGEMAMRTQCVGEMLEDSREKLKDRNEKYGDLQTKYEALQNEHSGLQKRYSSRADELIAALDSKKRLMEQVRTLEGGEIDRKRQRVDESSTSAAADADVSSKTATMTDSQ